MNKAEFFDQSHDDDWASRDYTDEEHHKLNQYLQMAGVEKGQKVLEPGWHDFLRRMQGEFGKGLSQLQIVQPS